MTNWEQAKIETKAFRDINVSGSAPNSFVLTKKQLSDMIEQITGPTLDGIRFYNGSAVVSGSQVPTTYAVGVNKVSGIYYDYNVPASASFSGSQASGSLPMLLSSYDAPCYVFGCNPGQNVLNS